MRVEAHLHIRRFLNGDSDCISTRFLPDGQVFYTGTLALSNVTFAVQPAGRAKAAEGQKNVHAFVRGEHVTDSVEQKMPTRPNWRLARYNPKNCESFVDAQTGSAIYNSDFAILCGNKVFYWNP